MLGLDSNGSFLLGDFLWSQRDWNGRAGLVAGQALHSSNQGKVEGTRCDCTSSALKRTEKFDWVDFVIVGLLVMFSLTVDLRIFLGF